MQRGPSGKRFAPYLGRRAEILKQTALGWKRLNLYGASGMPVFQFLAQRRARQMRIPG
jgi:hypothetical protein